MPTCEEAVGPIGNGYMMIRFTWFVFMKLTAVAAIGRQKLAKKLIILQFARHKSTFFTVKNEVQVINCKDDVFIGNS